MSLYEVAKMAVKNGGEFKYQTPSDDFLNILTRTEFDDEGETEGRAVASVELYECDDDNLVFIEIKEGYTGCDLYVKLGSSRRYRASIDRNLMTGFCQAFLGANESLK